MKNKRKIIVLITCVCEIKIELNNLEAMELRKQENRKNKETRNQTENFIFSFHLRLIQMRCLLFSEINGQSPTTE